MELGNCLKHAYAMSLVILLHISASKSLGLNHFNVTGRCLERERDALLAIKGDLVDKYNLLSSWGSKDCCKWERVQCDHQTGHVIQLRLGGWRPSRQREYMWKTLQGDISPKIIELQYLEYLDLSCNFFNASQIPALICSLSNLRHLDIHDNDFTGSKFLKLIGNLTNLRYLDLSDNALVGQIPYHHLRNLTHLQYLNLGHQFNFHNDVVENQDLNWLPHLSSLKYLDLSTVNLSKAFDWPETINKLPNLRNLTLQGCDLTPPILSTLSHVNSSSSLVSVELSGNFIVNHSIFKWLCNYNNTLTYLDLSFNQLTGLNPNDFRNMRSLELLDLSSNQLSGSIPNDFGNMRSLELLDLSFNQLSGWIPDIFGNMSSLASLALSFNPLEGEIPTSIGQLCSLQDLYISSCNLIGQLSESLQNLSACPQNSLQGLYLFNNHLAGSIPNLTNFSSLTSLILSGNKLRGVVPDSIGELSRLYRLDLSVNLLSGRVPENIGQLSSLEDLDISGNQLSGKIPKSIGKLSLLSNLDLHENLFSGSIPDWIGELSSLFSLDLSRNRLEGRLPESIGQIRDLSYINLSMNHLEGAISETHFSKLFELFSLDLSYNPLLELNLTSGWIPPFQNLYSLSLRTCKVGPYFPNWLQTQTSSFSYLDLSYGNISDLLPNWLWGLFYPMSTIDLSHNQIRGTLRTSENMSFTGVEVRLSSNKLEGLIPTFLSNVKYLDLSSNRFTEMKSFLCGPGVRISAFLNLSINHFSGQLPDCWSHYVNLEFLDLSNNAFSGRIPPSLGSLLQINTLKLRSNKFVGEVPSSLKNCTSLKVIDLAYNKLSRSVPEWLGVCPTTLVILMLQANQFSGTFPSQLCHLAHLQILDISENVLAGTIPACLSNLTSMAQEGNSSPSIRHPYNQTGAEAPTISPYYDDDATFMWKGTLASYKSILGLVKRIDLSSNRLTGEIPSEITHLVGLVSLNLSRNHLNGRIPLEIGKLESLDSLDLSRNKIHGGIPTSLAHIYRLSAMNLSYNNLSGKIPTGTQLQGFDASSYIGNPLLCGPPLVKCNPEGTAPPNGLSGQEDADELITQGFYISLGLGFAVGFWGVCGSLIFKRSWRYAYYNSLMLLVIGFM